MNNRSRPNHRDARAFFWPSFVLLPLLILPGYAASRYATRIDWRLLIVVPVALSVFAFLLNRNDKRRAESGEWRIPESTLHLAELCGGWPGAFLAMRRYRHKISKGSYQFTFWLIVLIYQWAALDSLFGFRYSQTMFKFIAGH